jgi:hypothetical protein
MSKMRNSGVIEITDALREAAKLAEMPVVKFADDVVRPYALTVNFPALGPQPGRPQFSIARAGNWQRWTNGQDPIQRSYKEEVRWTGSAKALLEELGM